MLAKDAIVGWFATAVAESSTPAKDAAFSSSFQITYFCTEELSAVFAYAYTSSVSGSKPMTLETVCSGFRNVPNPRARFTKLVPVSHVPYPFRR